ncbi:hypothetical protein [Gleimia coleocanis]|nr:hypothetical protein [Gleimia coleocanis]
MTLKTRFGLAAQTLEQLLNGKTNHTLEIPEATEILIRLALE